MLCVALADADRRHQEAQQLRRFRQLQNCLGGGRRPRRTPALSPGDWDREVEPSPHPGPSMSPPAPSPCTVLESTRSRTSATSMTSIPESELHRELVRDVAKLYTSKLFADLVFVPPSGTVRAMVAESGYEPRPPERGREFRRGGDRAMAASESPWHSPARAASSGSESDEGDEWLDEWASVEAHLCIVWARAPKLLEILGVRPGSSRAASTSDDDTSDGGSSFQELHLPAWLPAKALRVLLAYCYTDEFRVPGWDDVGGRNTTPYSFATVKQLVVVANVAAERLELPGLHVRCLQAMLRGVHELDRALRVFVLAAGLRGRARKYVQVRANVHVWVVLHPASRSLSRQAAHGCAPLTGHLRHPHVVRRQLGA